VTVKQRIVVATRLEKPTLDPACDEDIRAVVRSNADFDPENPCGFKRFAALLFSHRRFVGRGEFLLRWLGLPARGDGYARLLVRLYPEATSRRQVEHANAHVRDRWCRDDVRHLRSALLAGTTPSGEPEERFLSAWRALAGGSAEPWPTPEAALILRQECAKARAFVGKLSARRAWVVRQYFGLGDSEPQATGEIAQDVAVSSGRVYQLLAQGLRDLRGHFRTFDLREAPWQVREWPASSWVGEASFGDRQPPRSRALDERGVSGAAGAPAASTAPPCEPVGEGSRDSRWRCACGFRAPGPGTWACIVTHMMACSVPLIEDVDGRYEPTHPSHPHVADVIRRVRKIALLRFAGGASGRAGTILHIDYGGRRVPCGRLVDDARGEVPLADYVRRRNGMEHARLCRGCEGNLRPEAASELQIALACLGDLGELRAEKDLVTSTESTEGPDMCRLR
jgi:hypothetical protein